MTNVSLALPLGAQFVLQEELVITGIRLSLVTRGGVGKLDANRSSRIFKVADHGILVLRSVLLGGGFVHAECGGAILVTGVGSELHADHVTVDTSEARGFISGFGWSATWTGGYGGGIALEADARAQLIHVAIVGCESDAYGGGLSLRVRCLNLLCPPQASTQSSE